MTVRHDARAPGVLSRWAHQISLPAVSGWVHRCWVGDQPQAVLWLPVAMAIGIGSVFRLTDVPDPAVTSLLGLAVCLAAVVAMRRELMPGIGAALAIAAVLGAVVVPLRMEIVSAPVITGEDRHATITGTVESRAVRESGRVRLVIRPNTITRYAPEAVPRKLRLSAHAGQVDGIRAGDRIRLRAILSPPAGPVAPGAYDFARRAWFSGIGGTGFAVSDAELLSMPPRSWAETFRVNVERTREVVAARLVSTMGPEEGGIAAALLTGKRGGIEPDTLGEIRDSGLAHLLAISGLHMALVCGAVFWASGFVLALIPWIGVRLVVKKWSAVVALFAGAGYFLLAGGSIATERAFIMVAISLIAILLDRPAITQRNLAVAAVVILVLRPESLLDAGFQMSFGAVAALVAFYDEVRRFRARAGVMEPVRRWWPVRAVILTILTIAATTIVATLATGPLAATHFNRIAVYGLAANLIAVPLVSMLIMPLGLITLALMPFGLETYPATLMGAGITYLLDVSEMISGLDGAVRTVPTPPDAALVLFAIGGLWICLWRRSWRLVGILPLALAGLLAASPDRPEILASRDLGNIAVRGPDGLLGSALPRGERYSVEQWLRRDGDSRDASASHATHISCDSEACTGMTAGGFEVAFVLQRSAFDEECHRADILISRVFVPPGCTAPTHIIDVFDIRRDGPHAVFLEGDGPEPRIRMTTVAEQRGNWPWSGQHR